MGKKIFAFVAFSLVFAATCFAKQISIQIVQHNLTLDYVTEQSLIVEDELMNGFFNQGFIVTNSVAAVSESEKKDSDLFYTGLGDAVDGCSDYFVQIKLYYVAENSKKGNLDANLCVLNQIDWLVVEVSSGDTIKESSIKENAIKESGKKSGVNESIKIISNALIKEIRKVL